MEKYFVITKRNKIDNIEKCPTFMSSRKRKNEFQNSITHSKKSTFDTVWINNGNFDNSKNVSTVYHDKNVELFKKNSPKNKKQNKNSSFLQKQNSFDDLFEESITSNSKIENIFQEVYFSDITCSQIDKCNNNDINNCNNDVYITNNIESKDKDYTVVINNDKKEFQQTDKELSILSNSIKPTNSRHIKRISIFNDNEKKEGNIVDVNNQRFCIEKEKEDEKLMKQNIPIFLFNKCETENKKNKNSQLGKCSSNNSNTQTKNDSYCIQHISIFNKALDKCNNKFDKMQNSKLSSNRKTEKMKLSQSKVHQHIFIQEDKNSKIINESISANNLTKDNKDNNDNNINDIINNSNNNNIPSSVNHHSVLPNSNDSKKDSNLVYLKKKSKRQFDTIFTHSFHLSQTLPDEDVDVEKINFNFSSIIYDNPSTGAMKSCIGYVDPNYNKSEKNKSNLKFTGGLKQFLEHRENKIGQQSSDVQISNIFKGVVVYINGFSRNCTDVELKRLVRIHGGKVCWYMSRTKVTHVICSSLCESKIQDYLSSKVNHYKLVTDQWIIDSIKAKKRLSETPYLTLNVLKKAQNQRNLFEYIKK